jgi:hypothetical protein
MEVGGKENEKKNKTTLRASGERHETWKVVNAKKRRRHSQRSA